MKLDELIICLLVERETEMAKEFTEYLLFLTANELLVITRTGLILCVGPSDIAMLIKPYDF